MDYKKRDILIFGKDKLQEYAKNGGVLHFGDNIHPSITIDTVKKLIDEGYLDEESSQNYSPTARQFVEFCEKYPQVRMNGFVISPQRSDCDVVLTGLECDTDITLELILDFANTFHYADDFNVSEHWLYCWWD